MSPGKSRPRRALLRVLAGLLLLGLLAAGVAAATGGFSYLKGKPQVGVIRLSGVLWLEKDLEKAVKLLRYARDTRQVRALVLQIDSPGGTATFAEEVYLTVLEVRRRKPVVASVEYVAASGGYYIAVAANEIYAKPTSYVGSVGAWSFLPEPEEVWEDLIPTGPFKVVGTSWRKAALQLEMVKEGFLQAVISQRGERLKLGKEELSRAEIYLGVEALPLGLVDRLEATSEAIAEAARLAGVKGYQVVDLNEELEVGEIGWQFLSGSAFPKQPSLVPVIYYLYVEPSR